MTPQSAQKPEAVFDTLAIVSELEVGLFGISRLELSRTAYLACLLALYRGRPLADWRYRFACTDFGTPFSADISEAINILHASGRLVDAGGRMRLTDSGKFLYSSLRASKYLAARADFLRAACTSVLIVPPSTLSQSLDREPTIVSALQHSAGHALLQGPALQLLYEDFAVLVTALKNSEPDLLTPSIAWLTALANQPVSRRENKINT